MKALINFKICDNAKECGGIAACPTNAMYFDETKKSIIVDETCINCGLCEKECPIGAIMVANNDKQYQKYISDIENDSRTTKDLFVDRYGSASLSEFFLIEGKEFEEKTKQNILTFIEAFDSEIAECLLKSIPIKAITDKITEEVYYYKIDKDELISKQQAIKEYPTLLIFKQGNLLGKIEGYYSIDQKDDFKAKIDQIVKYNKIN